MKSTKLIAAKLLERRHRMTHIVLPGDLQAQIGEDGMQIALRNTWITPDYDSGSLMVNSNLGIVQEMERIAEGDCDICGKDCKCKDKDTDEKTDSKKPWESMPATAPSQAHGLAVSHSQRNLYDMAFGSGQPAVPAAPQVQPNIDSNRRSTDHMVGEDVVVAEEGKSYQAKVKAKHPDGTYELSFGQNRPASVRNYRKEEIQGVQPAPGGAPAPTLQPR